MLCGGYFLSLSTCWVNWTSLSCHPADSTSNLGWRVFSSLLDDHHIFCEFSIFRSLDCRKLSKTHGFSEISIIFIYPAPTFLIHLYLSRRLAGLRAVVCGSQPFQGHFPSHLLSCLDDAGLCWAPSVYPRLLGLTVRSYYSWARAWNWSCLVLPSIQSRDTKSTNQPTTYSSTTASFPWSRSNYTAQKTSLPNTNWLTMKPSPSK